MKFYLNDSGMLTERDRETCMLWGFQGHQLTSSDGQKLECLKAMVNNLKLVLRKSSKPIHTHCSHFVSLMPSY